MGAAIARQALLGATQNTAAHVSDKAIEGELPDANELGKLAVKGAVDGSIAGAGLHHAVVPTEGRAARQIEAAGNGNRNAHTIEKHGRQTTREEQLLRANTGQAPDGSRDKKLGNASKWLRNVDTSDGIEVAKRQWEENKRSNPDKEIDITVIFDKPIGEGYLKGIDNLIKTNKAVFRFNKKGDLITSFPGIRD